MRLSRISAAVFFLLVARLPAATVAQSDSGTVQEWLARYEAALASRDLERLANFFDREVTLFEGGGRNAEWADYRDHHLGLELSVMETLELRHRTCARSRLGNGLRDFELRVEGQDQGKRRRHRALERLTKGFASH